MGQDSQTVPVTVTVHLTRHQPSDHPGDHLPFTGAPLDVFAAAGLLLGATGAAVLAVVRGKSTRPQPSHLGSFQ